MEIHTEIKVSASAERAYAAKWTTALESSSLEGEVGLGAIRTCHSNKVGPFPAAVSKERLIDFDPEHYRFTYVVQSGLPTIFKNAQNAWSIVPINKSSCIIRSFASIEVNGWLRPINWIVLLLIKRDLKKVFEEMEYYIEHGKVHPRKAKSILEPANV